MKPDFPVTALLFTVIICFLFRAIWVSQSTPCRCQCRDTMGDGDLLSAGRTLTFSQFSSQCFHCDRCDGIHVVSRYREELQHDQDPEQAMGRTMRHMMHCLVS